MNIEQMNEYEQFVMATEWKGAITPQPQEELGMTEKEEQNIKTTTMRFESDNPFLSDENALYTEYGFLLKGMKIETTLQDLLKICPRKREKTDAYNGLVKHLKENFGVDLIITSRKKRKENDYEQK